MNESVLSAVVTTTHGPVRGRVADGVTSFKGIRYGADTAAHRFEPPREPAPWTETVNAFEFGPTAPQDDPDTSTDRADDPFLQMIGLTDSLPQSEDCLFLNVWTPSTAPRARETGAPTATAFDLTPMTDARLIEAGNHFEGVPVNRNRWVLAHPDHWRYYLNPLRPSWGEPYAELVARVSAAVRDAIDLAEGHEALLVSHQLPVWATRLWLEGRPLAHDPRRRQCSLASLTSLTFDSRTLVGLSYWEPAGDLLRRAEDMVPGTSAAAEALGRGPEPARGADALAGTTA